MYNDILGSEKTDDEILEEFDHDTWCTLYCIRIMNSLVDMGILEMSDIGDEPMIQFTDKGNRVLDKYWKEKMGREPNEEEIELGMSHCINGGLIE